MSQKCSRCASQEKYWDGDDPQCAFPDGVFTKNNWMCGTMRVLREHAEDRKVWQEDEWACLFVCKLGFVFMQWYKNRGCTEVLSFVNGEQLIALSIGQAEEVIVECERIHLLRKASEAVS